MERERLRDFWLNYPGECPVCMMLDGAPAMLISGPSNSAVERGDWSFGFQVPGEEDIRWREASQIELIGQALTEVTVDENTNHSSR